MAITLGKLIRLIVENEPLGYLTEREHELLESFADHCVAKIAVRERPCGETAWVSAAVKIAAEYLYLDGQARRSCPFDPQENFGTSLTPNSGGKMTKHPVYKMTEWDFDIPADNRFNDPFKWMNKPVKAKLSDLLPAKRISAGGRPEVKQKKRPNKPYSKHCHDYLSDNN